ncbi:MAG: hypothetical protein JXB88_19320 [Spirochaetales bacterium]|nr:hypothetical protein [Spirochaetales bacterium]
MDRVEELYMFIKEKYDTSIPPVKKRIKKADFFHYFFKEKKKIIEWNRKKYLLKFSFFKFKVKQVSNLHYKIDGFYLKYLLPVSKYLPEIITNGWQWQILSIREYNTIVFFKDFCNKCSHIGEDKSLSVKKYLLMEESFLKLICNSESIQILLKGLEKILVFYKEQFFKSSTVLASLLKDLTIFFSPGYLNPSFFDLILAYNISYYRKYLVIYDLMTNYSRNIIPANFFSCSRDIFRMIIDFLKKTMEDLKKLQTKIVYIEQLKALSTLGKDQPPGKIISFYSKSGHDWRDDCDDAFLLILILLEEIINRLGIFIRNEWQVMNEEERIIMLKIVSSKEADDVYTELEKEFQYSKARYTTLLSSHITLERFLHADNPREIILEKGQKYIYDKIGNMFSCLHDLACIFYNIYEKQGEGYKRILYYMITHPSEWRGKPVYALYQYYIELFLQIGGFFKEKKLQLKLEKYPKLIKEVKSLKEKLKWTSDTHNFIIKAIENDEKESEAENEK